MNCAILLHSIQQVHSVAGAGVAGAASRFHLLREKGQSPIGQFALERLSPPSEAGNSLACKPIEMVAFKGKQKKEEDVARQEVARQVAERHLAGTLSMIVCNRLACAQSLHALLEANPPESRPQVVLLHSRFRPADRQEALEAVLAFEAARKREECHPGLVLVSTQVVEAGFDVSSTRLWTQLAPWPSLIQRLGRLNRDGQSNADAQAFVFEMPDDRKDPLSVSEKSPDRVPTCSSGCDCFTRPIATFVRRFPRHRCGNCRIT